MYEKEIEIPIKRTRRFLSPLLALLNCVLLFLPWGQAAFGGEIKVGKDYSNPIMIAGSYPRGVAQTLDEAAEQFNGFQEQAEVFGMVIMMALIFLTVLEIIYAIAAVCKLNMSFLMGIVTEVIVLLLMTAAVILGLAYRKNQIQFGEYFRIVTDIRLNAVPFLVILFEILGKNVFCQKN